MKLGVLAAAAVLFCGGCDVSLGEIDEIYSRPGDGAVVCGISVDNKNTVSTDSIAIGLDKAQVEELVIHLYSHKPEGTVDESTIEEVVAAAADRDLPFVTYAQLVDGAGLYGLAFSFDDHDIEGWHRLLPLFARYGAKVTFFISNFHGLTEDEKLKLHEIAAAGHAVEYHSTNHQNAEEFAASYGVEQYYTEEILPDLLLMRAAGFDPHVLAYPFGARTAATDEVVLRAVPMIRGSYFNCPR